MLTFRTEQLRAELSRSKLKASTKLGRLKEEGNLFLTPMERWEAGTLQTLKVFFSYKILKKGTRYWKNCQLFLSMKKTTYIWLT